MASDASLTEHRECLSLEVRMVHELEAMSQAFPLKNRFPELSMVLKVSGLYVQSLHCSPKTADRN